MIGWIVPGVILAVLLLVLLCRIGVQGSFGQQTVVVARVGLLRLQIVPRSGKKQPKKEKKPKKEHKTEAAPQSKIKASTVIEFAPQIWAILKKGLHMTRQRVRIDPMELSLTIGGTDPADAANLYGKAQAAMWTFIPQLERLVRMPQPHIHLEPELQGGKTQCAGHIGASLLIWDLLVIGFACGIPALKLFAKMRKKITTTNNHSGKDEQHGKQEDNPQ